MGLSILSINPGSTSTKLALYIDKKEVFKETIRHSASELKVYDRVYDQKDFRTITVENFLLKKGIDIESIDALAVRGGVVPACESGVYEVNDDVCKYFEKAPLGEHASNLGALIGNTLSKKYSIPAYFVNPVTVDEMDDIARYVGHPLFTRKSIFHALNQIAVVKEVAESKGISYKEQNFIVVHLGGGISVGAHKKGRIVDVNNALYGDGPFSPERVGTVPSGQLVDLCFSGKYTKEEIKKILVGQGGVVAYLGTNNLIDVMNRVNNGDKAAKDVIDAMIYQISKEIGALATVLKGQVDNIIITGGLAREDYVIDNIRNSVSFIAPIIVVPGEDELKALALGVASFLDGKEKLKKLVLEV